MGEKIDSEYVPLAFREESCAALNEIYRELLQPRDPNLLHLVGLEEDGIIEAVHRFSRVTKSKTQETFLRSILRVYVAGFIFLKSSGHEVDPLLYEPSKSETARESLSFMTPYFWAGEARFKDAHTLVDCMFRVWRSRESLSGAAGQENTFSPEYFKYLPLGDAATRSCGRSGMLADVFGSHYVTHGEMKFTMFCWRLLLRIAQLDSYEWDAPLSEIGVDTRFDAACGIWSRSLNSWPNCRESDWAKFLSEPSPRFVDNPDCIANSFWLAEDAIASNPEADCWTGELCTLGLIAPPCGSSHVQATDSLIAMAGFASTILPSEDWKLAFDGTLSRANFEKLNRLFQSAARLWLCGKVATVRCMIETLNKNSRFPVMPYYYWEALDTGVSPLSVERGDVSHIQAGQKSHFVLPVWEQFDDTTVFKTQNGRVSSCIVGVAVVGTHPFEELDWTLRFDRHDRCFADVDNADSCVVSRRNKFERISLIRDYLERLAKVPAAIRYVPLKAANSRFSDWAHEVKNYVGPVADLLQHAIAGLDGEAKLAVQASTRRLRILQNVAFIMQSHLQNETNTPFGNWTQADVELALKYMLSAHDRLKGADLWSIRVTNRNWELRGHDESLARLDEQLLNRPEENAAFVSLFAILREVIENINIPHPPQKKHGIIELAIEVSQVLGSIVVTLQQRQIEDERDAFPSKGITRANTLFGSRGLNVAVITEKKPTSKDGPTLGTFENSREIEVRLYCK